MKKAALTLGIVLFGSIGFAQIPDEIAQLDGKQGNFNVEGIEGVCRISLNPIFQTTHELTIKNDVVHYIPVAIDVRSLQPIGDGSYLTTGTSERAGVGECGLAGGVVRYRETLKVTSDSLTVTQEFRCTFEGFKKYVITRVCSDLK